MAFNNNRYTQPQMPGAFPDADRDEFGLTKADYEQMMDEVDGKLLSSSNSCRRMGNNV